jgi:hypothetical protein
VYYVPLYCRFNSDLVEVGDYVSFGETDTTSYLDERDVPLLMQMFHTRNGKSQQYGHFSDSQQVYRFGNAIRFLRFSMFLVDHRSGILITANVLANRSKRTTLDFADLTNRSIVHSYLLSAYRLKSSFPEELDDVVFGEADTPTNLDKRQLPTLL